MRSDLRRAWALLTEGRSLTTVALEFSTVVIAAAALWGTAAAFVLMEPLP